MGCWVPAVVSPTRAPPLTLRAEGERAREPERSTRGVSSRSPGRVPQGRRLPHSQDAALSEQPRPGGVEVHNRHDGLHAPLTLNLAPAGWS